VRFSLCNDSVASHSLLARPPECAVAPPLQMVEASQLSPWLLSPWPPRQLLPPWPPSSEPLRLAAALSASGAASCLAAACRAAVLPLVLTTCGSKVQWHESRPLVYCMLPKALDSWASSVSPHECPFRSAPSRWCLPGRRRPPPPPACACPTLRPTSRNSTVRQ